MDVRLENQDVSLAIDGKTGAIGSVYDKARNREYISRDASLPPFRVIGEGEAQEVPYTFQVETEPDNLQLTWTLQGAVLIAQIHLSGDEICFRAYLQNSADTCVRAFEYPIFGPLQDYGNQGCLVHPYATGVLMRDPLSYLKETGGLRYAPYPESFSGASMQFLSYYEENKGGLYVAALDGEAHQKWLNAFRDGGRLAVSHMAGYENTVAGSGIRMDYDLVVRFTSGRGWQEPAEMYRDWALRQPWCSLGPARLRGDADDWLRKGVGYCTFGINAGHDRVKWLHRYREDIGTAGFHVLGPDWTNTPQTFGSGVPGDMCDWIPTRFNKKNLETIRDNGDRFAPFEFDFLVALDRSNPETLKPHLQRFPAPTLSHDPYHFSMLCPCDPFAKDFHRQRDLAVLREAGVDAMYYDISANNLIKICLESGHGHPPGGGKAITHGYNEVYEDTSEALRTEAVKKIPLGTEMINEVHLRYLDFYQARAWAQPSSTLETWPFREQMRSGLMKMVPLFDFVYHEMGPVRMDGWGKLVRETGDLFYHIVAKVYLWGGLYEINHEYSPMEELDGEETIGAEHYFRFDPQHYAYAPERAEYVGRFARMRTGKANRYLAYGRMTRPPEIDSPEISLDWYHYNHGQKDPSYRASGEYRVEAVLASSFDDGDGNRAIFLVNVDKVPHTVRFRIPDSAPGGSAGLKSLTLHWDFTQDSGNMTQDLGVMGGAEEMPVALTLAPREPYMLEIK